MQITWEHQSTEDTKTKQRIQSLLGDINFTFNHTLERLSSIWPTILKMYELSYKAAPQDHTPLGVRWGHPSLRASSP